MINERTRIREMKDIHIEQITAYLGQYLEKQKINENSKIDFQIFALTIFSFMYFLVLDKKGGKSFINHEKAVDEFINYFNIPLLL
jgi:hypothetical protein